MPSDQRRRFQIRAWIIYLSLVAGLTALDLWSKAHVFELLQVEPRDKPFIEFQEPIVIVPNFFEFEATYNRGAFSGWFSEHTDKLALLSAAAVLVISIILAVGLAQKQLPSVWFVLALGMICGGTIGNLYDRYHLEAVRDWIKWFVVIDGRPRVWPNFNIADAGICVGVAIMIVLEIVRAIHERREKKLADKMTSEAKSSGEKTDVAKD